MMLYAFQVHIPNLTVTLFEYWLKEDWSEISDGDANSMLFPSKRTDRKERRDIWATWLVMWRKYGPNSIMARQWKADTIAVTATGPEEFCNRVSDWIFRTWGASATIHESEDQDGPPLAIYGNLPDVREGARAYWTAIFEYLQSYGIDPSKFDHDKIARCTGKAKNTVATNKSYWLNKSWPHSYRKSKES